MIDYDTPYKFSLGERVETNFKGKSEIVTVIDRLRWRSGTGKGYEVRSDSGVKTILDENWLKRSEDNL